MSLTRMITTIPSNEAMCVLYAGLSLSISSQNHKTLMIYEDLSYITNGKNLILISIQAMIKM